MKCLLFVYGTLRQKGQHPLNLLLLEAKFVSEAWICGEIFNLGAYPGLVLTGKNKVSGEVFQIQKESIAAVDFHEGYDIDHPDESYFTRTLADVTYTNGQTVECWVYVVNLTKAII